jgi:hypothetical protein
MQKPAPEVKAPIMKPLPVASKNRKQNSSDENESSEQSDDSNKKSLKPPAKITPVIPAA